MNSMKRGFFFLIPVLLVALALGFPSLFYPFSDDHASFFYVGKAILHGKFPYKDAWDVKPPGVYLFFAGIQGAFGRGMMPVRIFDMVWLVLTLVFLYLLAARLFGFPVGIASVFFMSLVYYMAHPFWCQATPDAWMPLPLLLSMHLCLGQGRKGRTWRSFLGGVFLGIAVCLQITAILLVPPLLLIPFFKREETPFKSLLRHGLSLGGGFLALLFFPVLYLFLGSALPSFIETEFVLAPRYASLSLSREGDLIHRTAKNLFLAWDSCFSYFSANLFLVVPAGASLFLMTFLKELRWGAWIVMVIVLAVLGVIIRGKCFSYHWLTALPFLSVASGYTLSRVSGAFAARSKRPLLSGGSAVLGALVLLFFLTPALFGHVPRWIAAMKLCTGKMRLSEYYELFGSRNASLPGKQEVARFIQERTSPGDPIFVWGYAPLLYTLSNRNAPTRFFFNTPQTAEWGEKRFREELMKDLMNPAQRPRIMVICTEDRLSDVRGNSQDSLYFLNLFPALADFLESRYCFERRMGNFLVYSLKGAE